MINKINTAQAENLLIQFIHYYGNKGNNLNNGIHKYIYCKDVCICQTQKEINQLKQIRRCTNIKGRNNANMP